MVPELGHLSLIVALAFALCLGTVPLYGATTGKMSQARLARPLSYGLFYFSLGAIVILAYSFVSDDFSVKYIASHSNTQLPYYYKISAVWGGHEGSLLFWIVALCGWTALLAWRGAKHQPMFIARTLAVQGLIAAGFIAFTLLTSNPFDRLLPTFPLEGRDLNPMLQDIGLILHPPMLYMGYVGFSIAFAMACAFLLGARQQSAAQISQWAAFCRPWTLAAWVFLTLGIALGSWWAYYELGWGGWWFWDPVENASFMPWLSGTALLHCLTVSRKRKGFVNWTLLLAILTFSLSLLGTFLVRSGVLTSVHSFAADPSRGIFILLLLALAVGGSLLLFALKAASIDKPGSNYQLLSRESGLLAANILFLVATATVLLGTLYPLVIDALGMGKISVGPPYFNSVFVPVMFIVFIFMGITPLLRWKKTKPAGFKPVLGPLALLSIIFGGVFPLIYSGQFNTMVAVSMTLAFWITLTTLKSLWQAKSISQSLMAMSCAHLGVAICVVGITCVSFYEKELSVKMTIDKPVTLQDYQIVFKGIRPVQGVNYTGEQGKFEVYRGHTKVATLLPQRRRYNVRGMPMTEAGIDPGLFRDIYIALGEPVGENNAWAVRLNYKPMVRWIWLGALFMAIGGTLSIFAKRRRTSKAPIDTVTTNSHSLNAYGVNP